MNTDQVNSLVRSLLKLAGGALMAHGMTKVAAFINAEDVVGLVLAIVGFVMSHKWHSDNPTDSKPSTGAGVVSLFILCASLSVFGTGCASQGARLEGGGAYAPIAADGTPISQPDFAFYAVDSSFDIAASLIEGSLRFEKDNREMLWKISPSIKHNLDAIRPASLEVIRRYTRARAAYIANPTPAGLSDLQSWLSKVQALASAAVEASRRTN